MNKRLKCFLMGHDYKIHKDKKTISCKKCGLVIGVFRKPVIDEAWEYVSVYKNRSLFPINETAHKT